MKILGIDTTTEFLALGVSDGDKVYEYNIELARRHSCLLVPTIKRILNALDWKPGDIDYLACGLGPGSFTGVRIGLSAIKGLSWALKKPIVGISTLDILANNAFYEKQFKYIVPIIDAKRNLVYSSIYKRQGAHLKRKTRYMLLTVYELAKRIKPDTGILGNACDLYKDWLLRNTKGAYFLDRDYWRLQGRNIVLIAQERVKHNEIKTAFDIEPIYLYPKECQIKMIK